jgi:hypothetical protein
MLSRYTFDSMFDHMQNMAWQMQRDIERSLRRSFDVFDVTEHRALRESDENSTVYMKVKVNDNGHIWVKTAQKEPGQPWKTHIEEYNRGNYQLKEGGEDSFKESREVPLENRPQQGLTQGQSKGQPTGQLSGKSTGQLSGKSTGQSLGQSEGERRGTDKVEIENEGPGSKETTNTA